MPAFLISSKRLPDDSWQMETWTTDQEDAGCRAEKLITPPQMMVASCIEERGGHAGSGPITLWSCILQRCPCGVIVQRTFYLERGAICDACKGKA